MSDETPAPRAPRIVAPAGGNVPAVPNLLADALPRTLAEPMLLYALRYAIGRQTFAPSDVQAAVRTLMPLRDRGVRDAMVREIEEAYGREGGLGHATIDAPGWLALLEDLRA